MTLATPLAESLFRASGARLSLRFLVDDALQRASTLDTAAADKPSDAS